jgi:hypothetical protein
MPETEVLDDPDLGTQNEALLKRIRQRYRYGMDKWRRNREDGQKNMRYVSGDPWDDEDKQARKGRPTVCADELNQYVNQVVNTARQNPLGIKIDPAGDNATEQLAEYRENRIRAIEYACNASQAYINGLQAAVERNIGYWRVSRSYVSDESDEQEILILPIMNPDAVLIDPDYKELDGSDIRWAFELEKLPLDDFETEYPDAEKKSFSADEFGEDSEYWYDGKSILIASYWEVKQTKKQVGKKKRIVYQRTIQQYVTNGVEILRKGDVQPGPYIPIIPVFGKELWVDYGSGGERVLLSLVSLARDPQKALAYVMSAMLENMGQLPKTTFIGAVGQFETDEETWKSINHVFHPYAQYDPVVDATGQQTLPPPQRTPLTPDFQAYAVGVDICHRAIMSAMGLQALPTATQRANQKSGVALDKIQSSQAIGSYHLVDSYNRAIKLTGRIVNGWLSETDLGETKRPIRLADGKHKMVPINTDAVVFEGDHEYHFPIADDKGRYQVTISTGPSYESQREEGSEFADTLVANLKNLPVSGPQAAQLLAMVIRLKQLGPLGDQMADIISPQNQGMGQQMQEMQQQGAVMQEQMQKMGAQLQELLLEKKAKVIEMQGKMALQQQDAVTRLTEANLDRETKLAVAEIGTKAQVVSERNQTFSDLESQFHQQAHELGMQAQDQAHQRDMQQAQAEQQAAMAAQKPQIPQDQSQTETNQ